jgi:hypothetical protein
MHSHLRTIAAALVFVSIFIPGEAFSKRSPKTNEIKADELPEAVYPPRAKRQKTSGNTAYYVDLVGGDDAADGTSEKTAWRSFVPVNNRIFTKGDRILIVKPGPIHETIMPMTEGTENAPLVIRFAPGRYDVFREKLAKRKFHISNTNDDPWGLKAMAIYVHETRGVSIEGDQSIFFMRGKIIQVCVDHGEDVSFKGLSFDYHRPTVSEYRVVNIENGKAEIEIHKDSAYEINGGRLAWKGEGWSANPGSVQENAGGMVRRGGSSLAGVNDMEEVKPFILRSAKLAKKVRLNVTYQDRNVTRDCVGVLQQYSKNITWQNCNFHFLHGMGVVCQFTEDITFQDVNFAPRKESGRTCAAWADILHFSGCRGQINVFNVLFSGANDDAINVHGTYLRIAERISDDKIRVQYMHGQTFGFMQYFEGDEIDFIRVSTALPYATNIVTKVDQLDERTFELTLKDKVPQDIGGSVIENATWTPAVHIKGCRVEYIPTRGFLMGTRKKILIEDTVFEKPGMGIGILVEGSATGWYESGAIRDMTIRNCVFRNCNVTITTTAKEYADAGVHRNINIVNNTFHGSNVISAKHVENVTVSGNTITGVKGTDLDRQFKSSKNIEIKDNVFK